MQLKILLPPLTFRCAFKRQNCDQNYILQSKQYLTYIMIEPNNVTQST